MSANDDDGQGGAGRREVAWRVFAAEYDDADFDYSESDEERAPNYVVTPTGARVNRLFAVGVLTEVEQVSDDVLRGRVVDPTGAFVLYAGQYQPDEMAFLERADPPTFVAVTGKARTFQPEDSDRVFTSIRPESINEVDAETRDRWTVQTAEQTLARASTFADALDSGERGEDLRGALEAGGADAGLAAGIPLALDHYGTTRGYLAAVRDLAIDATRVVAGELDADDVGSLDLAPDEGASAADVALDYSPGNVDVDSAASASEGSAEPAASDDLGDAPTGTVDDAESAPASEAEAEPDTDDEPETEAEPDAEDASEPESAPDLGDAPEPEVEPGVESEGDAEAVPEADATADAAEPPEVEDAADAAELQEEVGTDEPPEVEAEQAGTADAASDPEGDADGPDLGTAGAGDEMYEFDDEEREQVEEEYGLEFSSGSEVDSPEESEMEPPEPGVEAESGDDDQHAESTGKAVDAEELQDVESAQGGTEAAVNADDQSPAGGETAATEAAGASVGEDAPADSGGEADESSADESGATDEGGETPDDLEDAVMDRMQDLDDGDGVEHEALLAAVVQTYDVVPADVDDAIESALMAGRCYESGEDTLKPI
ncbi:hypothetical protein [Halorussus halobius]|uniref:hypothetical protein n=1 Tax=Halorussus halobius TaxID=1710537 RepID=UPI001092D2C7|nr:hypothetical protein [Halorussus halobius]